MSELSPGQILIVKPEDPAQKKTEGKTSLPWEVRAHFGLDLRFSVLSGSLPWG